MVGDVKVFDKGDVQAMSDLEMDDQFRWVRLGGVRFVLMDVGGLCWVPLL
jgi:hypothetical protein